MIGLKLLLHSGNTPLLVDMTLLVERVLLYYYFTLV